jgi:hypothetical protein
MRHRFIKIVACISLVLMVFSVLTPGAFADETGTLEEKTEFRNNKMMHSPDKNLIMGPGMNEKAPMDKPVFETEEEEMEFLVERETEFATKRIEMLEGMLENIDEIEDENITEESIEEQIAKLETLLANIRDASNLEELRTIHEEYRENNPRPRGHGRECIPMHRPGPEEKVTTE